MAEVVPYILEDATADVLRSTFVDLEKRMKLEVRPTRQDRRTVLVIDHLRPSSSPMGPWEAMLTFAADGGLGDVHFVGRQAMSMAQYLRPIHGASLNRSFVAGNGRGYAWCYRVSENENEVWTCLDGDNQEVADYSLPLEDENYDGTSGCTFTVSLSARAIAPELLASLTIMRYIQQNRL